MNFNLTTDQVSFSDSVARFARTELAPDALNRAHSNVYPWDVAKLMADNGLLGITMSEADGGQGGTLMDAVIAIQTVALHCPKSADIVQAGNFGPIRTFAQYASPRLKEKYLRDLLAGRTLIGLGMSEPGAGSAVTESKGATGFTVRRCSLHIAQQRPLFWSMCVLLTVLLQVQRKVYLRLAPLWLIEMHTDLPSANPLAL
jgi:alkylation response protein AidB-like acyl-CoA dehydrogenase